MDNTVPPKVYELLREVVKEDIENSLISVHEPNKKGEGYLGKMCYISIKNKNEGKMLNLVIKEAFADDIIRTNAPIRNVFLNEICFYTKVWPCFRSFQKDRNLKNCFDKIPKCLATISDDCSEKIVMENIKYQNFEIFDKKKTVDKEHMEYIFTQYGKYHAISFAYRALNPENYSDLSKAFIDIYQEFIESKHFCESIKYIFEFCLNSLQPGIDDEVIEKYRYYIENGVDIFRRSNNYTGPYSVILHGDCWSNNMMFKYDEYKHVVDMRLLDFQLTKDGCPVIDLSYCLYSGGSKELLSELDYYLQVYHKSLSDSLNEFGFKSDDLYPFAQLKKDWKNHCQLGFTMGLLLWKVKLTYDEEILDLTDFKDYSEETKQAYFEMKYDETTFRERSRGLILHMYENDFL